MKTKLIRIGSFFVVLSALFFFNTPRPALAAACTKTSAGTGLWNNSGTWTPSGVPGSSDVVCIADGNTVTLNTDATIAELQIGGGTSGALTLGNSTTTRTLTVNGDVIVNAGATLDTTNTAGSTNQMNIAGDFTNASTNLVNFVRSNGGVANVTFNKAGTQNISSTGTGGFDFNSVTINSGATLSVNSNVGTTLFTIEGTITVNGTIVLPNGVTLAGSTATLTMGASGLIQTADANGVSGAANTSFNTGFTTTSLNTNGTVEYNASGNQTVTGRAYQNLTTSGSGTKTLAGTAGVNGNLTIGSGTILDTGSTVANVTGTYTNNGQLKHSSTQTINSVALRSFVDGTNNATADISANGTLFNTTVNSAAGGTNPYDTNCGTLTATVIRYWQITALIPGNATVKFYYRVSEINGLTNSNLQIWKCAPAATQWVQQGGTYTYGTGTTYNTVQSDTVAVGSTFVLASSGAPTAVSLSNANAYVTAENQVVLNWTTANELNTAGFNLYRGESVDGPYGRINAQLIPASGEALLGGTYEYVDASAVPGQRYFYQLADVEFNGETTRHQPISITVSDGGAADIDFGREVWEWLAFLR